MDHKSFESNMIDFVNRHSQVEEDLRNESIREARENYANIKRCKRTNAAIEAIVWVASFICIVVVMSWANWISFIPAEIAIAVCSLFGLIAGMRINTLAILFRKYGGG